MLFSTLTGGAETVLCLVWPREMVPQARLWWAFPRLRHYPHMDCLICVLEGLQRTLSRCLVLFACVAFSSLVLRFVNSSHLGFRQFLKLLSLTEDSQQVPLSLAGIWQVSSESELMQVLPSPAQRPQGHDLVPRLQKWSPEPRSPPKLRPFAIIAKRLPYHHQQASWSQIRTKRPHPYSPYNGTRTII